MDEIIEEVPKLKNSINKTAQQTQALIKLANTIIANLDILEKSAHPIFNSTVKIYGNTDLNLNGMYV